MKFCIISQEQFDETNQINLWAPPEWSERYLVTHWSVFDRNGLVFTHYLDLLIRFVPVAHDKCYPGQSTRVITCSAWHQLMYAQHQLYCVSPSILLKLVHTPLFHCGDWFWSLNFYKDAGNNKQQEKQKGREEMRENATLRRSETC